MTLSPADIEHFKRIEVRLGETKDRRNGQGATLLDAYGMHIMLSMMTGNDETPWRGPLLGKVLAYAWLSGMDEQCVFNVSLNGVIQVAQHYFGIINAGNHMPEVEAMRTHFFPRVKELGEQGKSCPWLPAIAERYHILVKWQQFEAYYADEKANVERWLAGTADDIEKKDIKKRVIRDRDFSDAHPAKPRIIRDR